jgi:hypothetical protein
MKAHDSEDFKVAMIKEANDHTTRLHWALWEKQNVPAGHKILSAIWAFKRKRRIDTPAVYKHKARINVHGGQQTYGVNYLETFSPVVNWFSTLVLSLIYQWKTRQIDFVLAFPQADVECELYMELPRGLIFEGCRSWTKLGCYLSRKPRTKLLPHQPFFVEIWMVLLSGRNGTIGVSLGN